MQKRICNGSLLKEDLLSISHAEWQTEDEGPLAYAFFCVSWFLFPAALLYSHFSVLLLECTCRCIRRTCQYVGHLQSITHGSVRVYCIVCRALLILPAHPSRILHDEVLYR